MGKAVKKILIILAAIFFVFIGASVIFVLTFDVNRYKGIIIKKISHAIEKDITLDRISLDFSHGLGCRVDGLALKEKNTGWDDAWLKARTAQISVRILPLFKKDVQVERIEIEGLDLKLNDEFLRHPTQPPDSSQGELDTSPLALGALKFLARVIVVKDSVITYMPIESENTIKLGISILMLNNVSLFGPVQVNAVLSTVDKGKDNIVVKCIVFPELSNKAPYIKTLDLKLDVGGLDLPRFLRTIGYTQAAEQLIDKEVRGIVIIRSEKLFLDPNKIFNSNISLRLSEFGTDAVPLKGGVKNLTLDAEISDRNLIIRNCSGLVGGGDISASLTIRDLYSVINKKSVPYLEAVKARIDLDGLDIQGIASVMNNAYIKESLSGIVLKGIVSTEAEKLYMDPEKMWDSNVAISLGKCSTNILAVPGGIKDVDIEVRLEQGDMVIKKLSGIVAGGLISASGTIKNIEAVVSQKGILETENVIMQFNLQDFNLSGLLAMAGNETIAKILKDKTIAGKVRVKSDRFSISQKEKSSGLSILLSQGMTDIVPIQGGVEDIELEAALEQNDLVVYKFIGSTVDGIFSIKGSIKDIFSAQLSNFDILCSDVNLGSLFPQSNPRLPRFQGIVNLTATITGQGLKQDQLMQSLTGSGSLKISRPVLKNMNILRLAFDKMDMIPGLVNKLRENLSENYAEVLKQKDTNFKPIDIIYGISQGKLFFKDAEVESDGFLVRGQGEIGLLGDIQIGSYLVIAPDISQAFIDIVRELRFLANEEGMINMPLAIASRGSHVSVDIDRDYVLRKLIVSKGSELLENIFKKKDKSQEEPQSQRDESQQDTEDSNMQQRKNKSPEPATLIKSIFDIIGSQDK